MTTAVLEGSQVRISSEYQTQSERVEDIYIQLPRDVAKVVSTIDGAQRSCSITKSIAFCGKLDNGEHSFRIEYTTADSLGRLSGRDVFRFNEYLPFRTKNHTFTLQLPIGTIIPQEEGKEPDFFLTPKPTDVLSDGQHIIITWNTENTNAVSISAVLEQLTKPDFTFIVVIISIGAALGAVVATYFVKRRFWTKEKVAKKERKARQKQQESKKLVPQFIEHEQMVVDLLAKAANNELWQKQILADTKFSKAKLSRIIRNLEQRGVVTKTIFGNTNKIALKK